MGWRRSRTCCWWSETTSNNELLSISTVCRPTHYRHHWWRKGQTYNYASQPFVSIRQGICAQGGEGWWPFSFSIWGLWESVWTHHWMLLCLGSWTLSESILWQCNCPEHWVWVWSSFKLSRWAYTSAEAMMSVHKLGSRESCIPSLTTDRPSEWTRNWTWALHSGWKRITVKILQPSSANSISTLLRSRGIGANHRPGVLVWKVSIGHSGKQYARSYQKQRTRSTGKCIILPE